MDSNSRTNTNGDKNTRQKTIKNVLIVDDYQARAEGIANYLRKIPIGASLNVTTTISQMAATNIIISETPFDILITDVDLSQVDGEALGGIFLAKLAKQRHPNAGISIYTTHISHTKENLKKSEHAVFNEEDYPWMKIIKFNDKEIAKFITENIKEEFKNDEWSIDTSFDLAEGSIRYFIFLIVDVINSSEFKGPNAKIWKSFHNLGTSIDREVSRMKGKKVWWALEGGMYVWLADNIDDDSFQKAFDAAYNIQKMLKDFNKDSSLNETQNQIQLRTSLTADKAIYSKSHSSIHSPTLSWHKKNEREIGVAGCISFSKEIIEEHDVLSKYDDLELKTLGEVKGRFIYHVEFTK